MNIVVCIKQVPGTTNVEVDPVTGVLKRDGIESKLNPYDLFALELAFSAKERFGGKVTVISMGPPQAKAALYEAVYMGADDGYLLCGREFAGADVLATSYTIASGVKKNDFDLVICGKQTTDGDTAQVGAEMAEFLGIEHAAGVTAINDCKDGRISVTMNLDNYVQTQDMKLPCLICTDKDINSPRLPSYKRKKATAEDVITVIGLSDFDDQDKMHYGLNGSPTKVERIFPPERNTSKEMFEGTPEELSDKLFTLLGTKKFI